MHPRSDCGYFRWVAADRGAMSGAVPPSLSHGMAPFGAHATRPRAIVSRSSAASVVAQDNLYRMVVGTASSMTSDGSGDAQQRVSSLARINQWSCWQGVSGFAEYFLYES